MSSGISPEFRSELHQLLKVLIDSGILEITWTDIGFIAFSIIDLLTIIFIITALLFRNRASRTAILCGLAGTFVSSLYPFVFGLLVQCAIVTEDIDLMIAAIMAIPLMSILFYVSVCIQWLSTIQIPRSSSACCLTFTFFFLFCISNLHSTTDHSSNTPFHVLTAMFMVIFLSGTSTMAFDSFYYFLDVITSEKLYIMKDCKVVGHLVKKGSEWVEIQLENVGKTSKLNIV